MQSLGDVERRAHADRVEVFVSQAFVAARPRSRSDFRNVQLTSYLGFRAEGLQLAVAADAMQQLAPVTLAFQRAVVDQPRDEIGGAKFGEQRRVEGDLVEAVGDIQSASAGSPAARSD